MKFVMTILLLFGAGAPGQQTGAPETHAAPAAQSAATKLTHEDLYFPQTELAKNFVAALAGADVSRLLELGADPFSFDGREVSGREQLSQAWRQLAEKKTALWHRLQDAHIETMLYADAVERFGPPPAKFRKLGLRRCHFAAVRLAGRKGFLLIMKKDRKDTWHVVAVAE